MHSDLTNMERAEVLTAALPAVDYRLDDIVTFVDFSMPPPDESKREPRKFTGLDMQMNLEIEDGVQVRCEFSADKQSYVEVQGSGSLTMNYSPEGVVSMLGRYTVNEGEMKYTLPIIPLKTFDLQKGSYIEFTGKPGNPTMNITATEQTKASVSNVDGSSRSVLFNVGLKMIEVSTSATSPLILAIMSPLRSSEKKPMGRARILLYRRLRISLLWAILLITL